MNIERTWLVWSNEHGGWWGPDHRGYTRLMAKAGRYSLAEAVKICDPRNMRDGIPDEVMYPAPEYAAVEEAA